MSTEMQPPRSLPLRVVGWMSLPWRHWIYIIGTLLFGLFFVTLAPVPFLARVLVLLIPFFSALALAMPYGGLHMDEWMLMALKYRMRPSAATISHEELKGQTPEELQRLLEVGLQEEESAEAAGFSLAGAQPEDERRWQPAGGWTANGTALDQGAPFTHRIYLTGTHGILRRSYSGLPELNGTGTPPAAPAVGGALPGPQGQAEAAWQSTAGQLPYPPSAPPVTSFQPSTGQAQYGQPPYPLQQSTAPESHDSFLGNQALQQAPRKPKKRRLW